MIVNGNGIFLPTHFWMDWISQAIENAAAEQLRQNEDAPAVIGPYEIYEYGERGRGKEAGPALNPLKGSSAFLPSDADTYRTRLTKLNLLKTGDFRLSPPSKKSKLQGKISPYTLPSQMGSIYFRTRTAP
jgi:hypothetical protein